MSGGHNFHGLLPCWDWAFPLLELLLSLFLYFQSSFQISPTLILNLRSHDSAAPQLLISVSAVSWHRKMP